STVSVKACVASGVTPFAAVIVIAYVPPVPASGVPAKVAVPSALSTKVTPEGSAPVSESIGFGKPVVVTVKVPAVPVVNVVAFALVMVGAWFTVSVKVWVASGATPLVAVIVSE